MIWIAVILLAFVLAWPIAITAYIVVTATKKVRDAGLLDQTPWWVKTVVACWGGVGIVIDAFIHFVWATVFQRDLPAKGEYVLTSRLKRYRRTNDKRLPNAEKNWGWLNWFEADHW